MKNTFNNRIGRVVVVDAAHAQVTAHTLREAGQQMLKIGRIAPQSEDAQC